MEIDNRIKFPQGKQKAFLLESKKDLELTWLEFANKLDVGYNTLRKNYAMEYRYLPHKAFIKICQLRFISEKYVSSNYHTEILNFYSGFGSIRARLPSNVNITFKKDIPILDVSQIELNNYDKIKGLKFPNKLVPKLAEEIGIHIGDGFLSNKKKEYRLKGSKEEKDYYDNFIKKLYKELFNININLKEYETTYGFEIYSKALWVFKNKVLKIPAGRKNSIEFPKIINVNDIEILASFIRGLFDTDGCVNFTSRYGYYKHYPRIGIGLISKKIIEGTEKILYMIGLKPYKYKDKLGYWHIDLNGYERLEKYSQLIGWSNPKHLKKVKEWKKRYPKLAKNVKA
ncbi:MAG: hypothetical protein CMH62_03645 [Nanoarchaeota archaeon]|nr:hypothetical protein [Nanoarchaeota archaeon]|tara:strand:+ start:68 stop:1093 length:1026 start_codon:yes stop_codon:yes gene_type:complete